MTRRRKRDPNTRTVVRLPEQPLAERVLDLAAPLLEGLGSTATLEETRSAVELAITFWNAKVRASQFWGDPRPKPLNDLRRKMTGRKAGPDYAETFERLCQRWQDKELAYDPRLVGEWRFELDDGGEPRLSCEMELPDGVEAHVPPPIEERVAIGGRFLDEVRIRQSSNTYLGFPVQRHRGQIGGDGAVTVYTQMPTAVALFAEGVLHPVGGTPVEVMVSGRTHHQMVLTEVLCTGDGGHHDVAVLVFKPADTGASP